VASGDPAAGARGRARMIPFEEALRRLDEACAGSLVPAEFLPLRAALGRTLRADQRARLDLPPFDKSAVDGYAVGDDPAAPGAVYRVEGTTHAGDPPPGPLRPGAARKVMTGAPVPAGTARVVMREDVEAAGGSEGSEEDSVRILRASSGRNFCLRGEDLHAGDLVFVAGATIGPFELGNLISAGITEVEVSRPVRVALLSTGNEIVDDPAELGPARIMNSNGPMLAALAARHGLEAVVTGRVPDDLRATRSALELAGAESDLVVVSGGVSEGDSDHVAAALGQLRAEFLFTRVAVKPGKPATLALLPAGARVLGLPGNPVSAWLMFHLLALRIVAHLTGSPVERRTFRLPLRAGFRRRAAERLEFVPARLDADGAVLPVSYHGSAHLSALATADGFFQVPVGTRELPEGAEVGFQPIGEGLLS